VSLARQLNTLVETTTTEKKCASLRLNRRSIHVIAVVASKKGLETLNKDHPDVGVTVCKVDEELDDRGVIIPGLGDAGNRLYKTQSEDNDEELIAPSKRRKRRESEDLSASDRLPNPR